MIELARSELALTEISADFTVRGAASVPGPLAAPSVLATSVRQAWALTPSPLGAPAVLGIFGDAYLALVEVPGPLAAPALLAVTVSVARVDVPGPLGAPAALGLLVYGRAAVPGPLGEPAVLGRQPVHGVVLVPGPLGSPAVLAEFPVLATASAPSMLSACGVLAYHDFTPALGDVVTRYVLDLVTPGGLVRVPMSSWQATLQTGRSNYVQAVVPAVLGWVDAINLATEFVVSRVAVLPDGSALEYEMARAPVGQAQFDRGPQRYTCTLSGYSPGFAVDAAPPVVYDRDLVAVRSVSSGSGGMRVRCEIDWLLRPGHRAFALGVPFVVAYINYYVMLQDNGRGDAYMDAGERN